METKFDWNYPEIPTFCNKCKSDKIVRLVWILRSPSEPHVEEETDITKCANCNSHGSELKMKPHELLEEQWSSMMDEIMDRTQNGEKT
tara:strand:+ start:571 stop:834 length:264 start_codon:yes stop_codon:yes gene_type:complete